MHFVLASREIKGKEKTMLEATKIFFNHFKLDKTMWLVPYLKDINSPFKTKAAFEFDYYNGENIMPRSV